VKRILFGDMIGGADVVVAHESGQLQQHLENFTEAVDSTYGAVFASGRIVCATANWWGLHTDELALLSCFILSDSPCSLSDTPVFLPVKSPTVPFRLISCRLTGEIQVSALCGPQPSLPEIQTIIAPRKSQNWRKVIVLQQHLVLNVVAGYTTVVRRKIFA